MNEEIIDESKKEIFKADPFMWIGVGVFFWACISGYGYIFEIGTKDILILIKADYQIIYWGSNLFRIFALVICIWLTLNKFEKIVKSSSRSASYLFRVMIIAFIISQGLQFFYTLYLFNFFGIEYFDLAANYYSNLLEIAQYEAILDVVFSLSVWLFVGGILYSKSKKFSRQN